MIHQWLSLVINHIHMIPAALSGEKPFWRVYRIEENWLRITFLYFPLGLENKKIVLLVAMTCNNLNLCILPAYINHIFPFGIVDAF